MPFDVLPPELILRVVSYLPIQEIVSFALVSRSFHEVVRVNEGAVYQAAAALHGFIKPAKNAESAPHILSTVTRIPDATGWLDDVTSWKELCRRYFLREQAWRGEQNSPSQKEQLSLGVFQSDVIKDIHRFKIDEVERTIICTTGEGGLFVMSIDTDEILWCLPEWYVSGYAHVEYDNGFIVFTCIEDGVEVWRRSTDSFNPETYLPCKPNPAQIEGSPSPVPEFPPTFPPVYEPLTRRSASTETPAPSRGVYLPFALLTSPAEARCYRLVYPHLLVASEFSRQAYIWDVRTSTLAETISIQTPPRRGGFHLPVHMTYVELSDSFVFVCWTFALAVYRRGSTPGTKELLFSIDISEMVHPDPGRKLLGNIPCSIFSGKFQLPYNIVARFLSNPEISPAGTCTLTKFKKKSYTRESQLDWFTAVHVSPDGRDLVAVTRVGWLLWMPDFQVTSPKGRSRTPFRLIFTPDQPRYVDYLAFDGKRILLAIDSGIVSITLKDYIHPADPRAAPQIRHLVRLPGRGHHGEGRKVSCLQLHSGSAWFSYIQDEEEDFEAKLAFVDLTGTSSERNQQRANLAR
ncbi:hypothetical protein FRC01_006060 [Tulasnella sp. 417]|nr:hypothetical protein FRC01_006060 [Tulasnella sp. 417]